MKQIQDNEPILLHLPAPMDSITVELSAIGKVGRRFKYTVMDETMSFPTLWKAREDRMIMVKRLEENGYILADEAAEERTAYLEELADRVRPAFKAEDFAKAKYDDDVDEVIRAKVMKKLYGEPLDAIISVEMVIWKEWCERLHVKATGGNGRRF